MGILKFEFIKMFKNKSFIGAGMIVLMSLFALFYIQFFNSQLTGSHSSLDSRSSIERNLNFSKEYQGELTDGKVKTIVSDYLDIYREKTLAKKDYFDYFQWAVVDTFTVPSRDENIYNKMLEAIEKREPYTIDRVNLLSMKEVGFKKTDFSIKIGNFKTWSDLFKVTAGAFIPVALFVLLFCSLLFANDTTKNILPLLLSTRYGRTKMISSKLLVGTLLTIGTFLLVQGIILVVFGSYYGFSGWDVSVQANLDWKIFDFPLGWTNLHAYLFGLVFHLIGLLFIAGITMFISSLSGSPFSALAISLGIFFLPQVLTNVFLEGIPNKILYLFPINTMAIDKVMFWMSRDNLFFFHTFLANITLIVGVMFVLKIVFDSVTYFRMKRLSVA